MRVRGAGADARRCLPGVVVFAFALAALGCSGEGGSGDVTTEPAPTADAVPFRLAAVAEPPVVPDDSPWREVKLEIQDAPASVAPGDTLEFVVAITNGSASTAIDPRAMCPAYFMNFGESSISLVPVTSRLNCDEADTFGPGAVERFAMELDVPADFELDAGTVYWRLESVADTSSDAIVVEGFEPGT